MHIGQNRHIIYYQSYHDDVVKCKGQNIPLPEDYSWLLEGRSSRFLSHLLRPPAQAVSGIFCRWVMGIHVENRQILDRCRDSGFCLYANHTQPVGDAMLPLWLSGRRQTYVLVSPANLGIPLLGRLLPYLGALPVSDRIQDLKALNRAVQQRLSEKACVVIYPEAHVWPYYTEIRPFSPSVFHYPASADVPVFCMTTTYQKPRFGTRPKITVFLDGPFFPTSGQNLKGKKENLCRQVRACMEMRSKYSTYRYYSYRKGVQQ